VDVRADVVRFLGVEFWEEGLQGFREDEGSSWGCGCRGCGWRCVGVGGLGFTLGVCLEGRRWDVGVAGFEL
jgi:hypothetical protein